MGGMIKKDKKKEEKPRKEETEESREAERKRNLLDPATNPAVFVAIFG